MANREKVESILKVAAELAAASEGDIPGAKFRLRQAIGLTIAAVMELINDEAPSVQIDLSESTKKFVAPEQEFTISFPPVTLSVDDIWPPGEAPENPTAADVITAMRGSLENEPGEVASEWNLIDELTVYGVDGNPVTWDPDAVAWDPDAVSIEDLEACDEDD